MNKFTSLTAFFFLILNLSSQDSIQKNIIIEQPKVEIKKANWYDKISIRGYTQVRYNRLFETNPNLKSEQGDKSIGNLGGFFIRRLRVIIFGQVHEHVYFYIQPDFASSASSTGLHFGQLRDAYFDVSVDKKREFRFRFGQSKVPFGFENMQSSQNRLPLDRNDALNSAVSNERDLGVFFMYAPKKVRELYSSLVNDGYKGSGDYGVFACGLYNGQTANKPELNNNSHFVARLSYPFKIKEQVIEPGIQGYTGIWTMPKDQITATTKVSNNLEYLDERYAGSLILYPKPFGIQAEYNIGKGPEYDVARDSIMTKDLKGGYVTLSYLVKIKKQTIIPFVRGTIYEGGKKHELDARAYNVKEIEGGIEYLLIKNFEFTASFVYSDRTTSDKTKESNHQKGSFLRLQAQLNF
ncbi:MAG: porin [Bacteroidota bacterium]|nr:porin [Bacteroidota bacterium]MDP3146872.1 porin [Bacteroidota bacterium]